MHPYDGRVTSNFLVQAINNEDITVYGAGDQTRSFCFVDDLVDGLIRLMNQNETVGPVNIGNPGEFTIKQLAELAIKTTGSSSKIIYQPLPGDDPKQRKPDITKARPPRLISTPTDLHPNYRPQPRTPSTWALTLALALALAQARKFLKWEPKIPLEQGIVKAAEYFKNLDLSRFKKPTKHTAHQNTDELEQAKKKQKK